MDGAAEYLSEKLTQFLQQKLKEFNSFSEEIEKIKTQYPKILDSLFHGKGENQKVKQQAFLMGREFFEKGLSYMLLLDINSHLSPYIVRFLSKGKNEVEQIIDTVKTVEEKIRFVENTVAYGYLSESIKQDKEWIREKLKIIKNSESTMKPFIRDHLIWVNRVLEDIRKLRAEPSVPVGHYSSDLGKRLEHSTNSGVFGQHREELIKLHKKIHVSTVQIYHFLHKKDYKHLLLEYLEFFNLVGKLVSLLGITFAVMYEEDANIDPLTKVLSRRSLEFILSSNFQIAKISKRPLSVAMVDIDNFKRINDLYGHQIGDCVLTTVAQRIQQNLRKSDFIFRYGGEEFLVLLPFTPKEDAVKVIQKVVREVSKEPIRCGDFQGTITVSAGVSSIEEAKSIYSLISQADRELYRAKSSGKNQVSA
ncbi:MAG: sensor domain-containing diguanylate cyclase [Aquificae bacterium]|nr:sensor domain-containing diguanylate cyclase [Aquificota bacterium]